MNARRIGAWLAAAAFLFGGSAAAQRLGFGYPVDAREAPDWAVHGDFFEQVEHATRCDAEAHHAGQDWVVIDPGDGGGDPPVVRAIADGTVRAAREAATDGVGSPTPQRGYGRPSPHQPIPLLRQDRER